jgi:hypothetical protein
VIAQDGRKFSGGDGAHIGTDFAVGLAVDAGAQENDAGVGIRGMQGQCDRKTGMHADAADRSVVAERRLPARFHTITVPRRGRAAPHCILIGSSFRSDRLSAMESAGTPPPASACFPVPGEKPL